MNDIFQKIAKNACVKLDRLLVAIDDNRKSGHTDETKLIKAYEDAEQFLDDVNWEDM